MNSLKNLFRSLYKSWMAFARALGIVNATILLTIVYFTVIGIMFLIIRLLRKDLLSHRTDEASTYWRAKDPVAHTIEQARHQF